MVMFDIISTLKGYRFKRIDSVEECSDANHFYDMEGAGCDKPSKEKVRMGRIGKINFAAYHNGKMVGAVRLSDPWIASQGHEIFGFDDFGIVYEIEGLAIKAGGDINKTFVMLGLFKTMYLFSVKHFILSWSANNMKNVCNLLKGFCSAANHDSSTERNDEYPPKDYHVTKKIRSTTFSIDVASLEPSIACKKYISQWLSTLQLPPVFSPLRLRARLA